MGQFKFCEDNNGGGDIVAILDDSSEQHINLTIDPRFSNDEARSVVLEFVRPGTRLEVYDNSSAKRDDDWAVVEVKKSGPNVVVGTFQQNVDNDYYKITYPTTGNLDGKVSHIKVFPGPPHEPTTLEKIHQRIAAQFGNFPAKNGNAFEYNSQGSNYRVYRPELSQRVDNGYDLSVKLDHIRSLAQDDHALLKMSFDQYGMVLTVDSTVEIAGDNPLNKTLNVLAELPAEQRSNKYVAISTSILKVANAIYADILALGEGGGRLNFPEVVRHTSNKMGVTVVDVVSPETGQVRPPLSLKIFHQFGGKAAHPEVRLTVDPGYKIISGGARVNWEGDGNLLTASYPENETIWVAKAKDHLVSSPANIEVWAIAIHDPNNEWEVEIRSTTSDPAPHPSSTATISDNFVLTGGGAFAHWTSLGSLLTASFPQTSKSWYVKSKDHRVAEPVPITAYAIGIRARNGANPEMRIFSNQSSVVPHPSVSATVEPGYTLVGGGAFVDWNGSGNLLTASYPVDSATWEAKSKDHVDPSPASIISYAIGLKISP